MRINLICIIQELCSNNTVYYSVTNTGEKWCTKVTFTAVAIRCKAVALQTHTGTISNAQLRASCYPFCVRHSTYSIQGIWRVCCWHAVLSNEIIPKADSYLHISQCSLYALCCQQQCYSAKRTLCEDKNKLEVGTSLILLGCVHLLGHTG